MSALPQAADSTREITVLAEDPTVLGLDRKPLLTKVRIPSENLLPGPRGARVEVIDYDASAGRFYTPADNADGKDLFKTAPSRKTLESDPRYHAQHVYGVVAATLFEFERALGRSLSWGFAGRSHQLKVAPHAFNEPNAFYSREDEALLFGYYEDPGRKGQTVFTCLSHDIVAHETTHALLDGLRDQLMRPSHPQQAGFHEGYSDIVALLSVLRSESLIQHAMRIAGIAKTGSERVPVAKTMEAIKNGKILFALAKQMGETAEGISRKALRNSIEAYPPSPKWLATLTESHDLGEVLVAATMRAYFEVWSARATGKFKAVVSDKAKGNAPSQVEAWRFAEEGAKAAQHLLTMVIRAIDYLPCVHITFDDFLMALLTSDWQTCQDDTNYGYRKILLSVFASYGIRPTGPSNTGEEGTYSLFEDVVRYGRGNAESMRVDRDGMFRFIWDNRDVLGLVTDAYTRVNSVRNVWRVAPHGQIVRETVAEFYQLIKQADIGTLKRLGIEVPKFMDRKSRFDLVGGGILIFDEFGTLKFYVSNHLNSKRQAGRLVHLGQSGELTQEAAVRRPFAMAHKRRAGFTTQSRPAGGFF